MVRRPPSRAMLALVAFGLGAAGGARAAAEDVKDPQTAVSFWSPDGWRALSEAKASFAVHRRVAPDEQTFAGLLAGKVAGDVDDLLEAMEAYWREGTETFTRISKSDD